MQRTSIRGHAVRRVDAIDGLFVYAVAYGGGEGGEPHDALSTQLWPSARIAAGLVADAAPASMLEIGCGLALPSLAAARAARRSRRREHRERASQMLVEGSSTTSRSSRRCRGASVFAPRASEGRFENRAKSYADRPRSRSHRVFGDVWRQRRDTGRDRPTSFAGRGGATRKGKNSPEKEEPRKFAKADFCSCFAKPISVRVCESASDPGHAIAEVALDPPAPRSPLPAPRHPERSRFRSSRPSRLPATPESA